MNALATTSSFIKLEACVSAALSSVEMDSPLAAETICHEEINSNIVIPLAHAIGMAVHTLMNCLSNYTADW